MDKRGLDTRTFVLFASVSSLFFTAKTSWDTVCSADDVVQLLSLILMLFIEKMPALMALSGSPDAASVKGILLDVWTNLVSFCIATQLLSNRLAECASARSFLVLISMADPDLDAKKSVVLSVVCFVLKYLNPRHWSLFDIMCMQLILSAWSRSFVGRDEFKRNAEQWFAHKQWIVLSLVLLFAAASSAPSPWPCSLVGGGLALVAGTDLWLGGRAALPARRAPERRRFGRLACRFSQQEVEAEESSESEEPSGPATDTPLDDQQCLQLIREGGGVQLTDARLLQLVARGKLKTRTLEAALGGRQLVRAISLRRRHLMSVVSNPWAVERIPHLHYDYRPVLGQCCEEVIGYVPIPVGRVGPLLVDGREHFVPMATTEGCLVASANRGARALHRSGGATSVVFRDQMTRAPVVLFPSVADVVQCISWLESDRGFRLLKQAFDSTSAHADLLSVFPNPSGRYLHVRFAARTGDAMGMNMVTKATERALRVLSREFPNMQALALSGNMCTDKKPAAINYVLGRGKSVLAEARLPAGVLAECLGANAARLVRLAAAKNFAGSAMAGSPGMAGCNAHAANVVAAVFAATGQDLAQVVDSSACLTQLELEPPRAADGETGDALVATVTMPCLEVGVVGGGTRLPAQHACLDLIDLEVESPTEHLARIVAVTVLAAELSLLASLDAHDLVDAHMRLNRAKPSEPPCAPPAPGPAQAEQPAATRRKRRPKDVAAPDAKHPFM